MTALIEAGAAVWALGKLIGAVVVALVIVGFLGLAVCAVVVGVVDGWKRKRAQKAGRV